jgi:hypothetical protein
MRAKLRAFALSGRVHMVWYAFWAIVWFVLYAPGMTIWSTSIAFLMFVSLQTALNGALQGFTSSLGARKADPEDDL